MYHFFASALQTLKVGLPCLAIRLIFTEREAAALNRAACFVLPFQNFPRSMPRSGAVSAFLILIPYLANLVRVSLAVSVEATTVDLEAMESSCALHKATKLFPTIASDSVTLLASPSERMLTSPTQIW